MRIGDGEIVEPGVLTREAAEPRRADDHSDDDEADNRRDSKPREGRDDDARRAEDDQCVTETGSTEPALHTGFRAGT